VLGHPWVSIAGNLTSVASLIITVLVWINVAQISHGFLFRARVPQLARALKRKLKELLELLSDLDKKQHELRTWLSECAAKIENLRLKLPKPYRDQARQGCEASSCRSGLNKSQGSTLGRSQRRMQLRDRRRGVSEGRRLEAGLMTPTEKTAAAVSKLIRLTQEGWLVWHPVRPCEQIAADPEACAGTCFATEAGGQRLLLFEATERPAYDPNEDRQILS
jgi:hypothetical protein